MKSLATIMKLLDAKFDWYKRRQGTAKKMQKDLDIAAPKDERWAWMEEKDEVGCRWGN